MGDSHKVKHGLKNEIKKSALLRIRKYHVMLLFFKLFGTALLDKVWDLAAYSDD